MQGYLRIGGTKVLVRDVGEGPPVVLINGIGAHVGMWGPLESALRGMRVISFDAPGTGRSQTRVLPSTMPGLATLVERIFNRLELARADVLGYSFGGALAQQFAVQAPTRVRRLVLASTIPGWGGVPGRLRALLSMGTPLRYYSRGFYELTAPTIAGGRARHDPDHVQRLWRDRSGHAPTVTGYAYQLWAMTMFTSLPWLSRIECPTLIMVGDDDPLVPISNALMMSARMPCARVFVTRGEGHFQLLDEDSAALPAIRQFLSADRLEDAPLWRSSPRANPAEVKDQIRADGLGALPWGAVSAVIRRLVGLLDMP